ncbi:hypothetical protein [Pleurocapsa sp. PCC 7319]|uniref:hypothetical protein n=1 Tax=Pleurocapsa sp. PCC 7319 TaxID=118161 RepID=UPI001ED9C5EF|nr:hypothetical protein [Pleurocapsa sp. PCC 7319]
MSRSSPELMSSGDGLVSALSSAELLVNVTVSRVTSGRAKLCPSISLAASSLSEKIAPPRPLDVSSFVASSATLLLNVLF